MFCEGQPSTEGREEGREGGASSGVASSEGLPRSEGAALSAAGTQEVGGGWDGEGAPALPSQGGGAQEGGKAKARKPYTISKQRERWTDEEHSKFVDGVNLHGRQWCKIEEYIGTKSSVQIRSHAQKFFTKVEKQRAMGLRPDDDLQIPPPRPKRKPSRPYPKKERLAASSGGDAAGEPPSGCPSGGEPPCQEDGGAQTQRSAAAVALAASVAAGAAAAAVVAAAGPAVREYLQRQPPQGSPFFGIPPSVLGYICNMQLPQVMGATHIDQAPSAQASKDDAVESKEGTFAETLTKAEQLKVSTASMPPAQGFQDRALAQDNPAGNAGCPSGVPGAAAGGPPSPWMQQAGPIQPPGQNFPVENGWRPPMDPEAQAALKWALWHIASGSQAPLPPFPAWHPRGGKPLADAPSTHSAPAGTSNFPGSSKLPCWWSAEQAMKQQPGRDRKRQRQSTSDSKPAHEALDGFEAISTALQQYNPLLRSAPCSAPSSNQDDQTAWRFSRMAPGPFPFVPNPGEGTSSGPACALGSSLCSAYGSMQNSSANVNESFVGSNVLNGSNNSSHSSQGGGSDGGKASGHNGQSAWNHMDPSRWTTAMQGAPDLSQSLLVTSWMPSTAASPTGPFLMHGHQQWGSNPMGAMKGAADSTGCDGSGRQRPGESCALANNDCSFPPVASMASSGMTPESIGMLLSQLGANPYVQNQMQQNCLAQLLLMQSQNMQMGMRPKAVGQPPAPGAAPLPDEGNSQLLNLLMQSGWSHSESMSGVRQSPQQMSQK